MALIVATIGAAGSNSYATVAASDSYLLEERLGALLWDEVINKPAALIMATYQLDRLAYVGLRADTTQALEWPRSGAAYPDGRLIANNVLPIGLVRAVMELAYWLSQGDRTVIPGGETLAELKAGPINLKFRDLPGTGGLLATMPDIVRGHLKGLTTRGTGSGDGFRKVLKG